MAKAKFTISASALLVPAQILPRMETLHRDVYEAFCSAVTVEYALLHQRGGMDEEISVCVKRGIVRTLDRVHSEVEAILGVLMKQQAKATAEKEASEAKLKASADKAARKGR